MQGNFDSCLAFTLHPENDGQACHCSADDPGGWTAYGVTRANWSRWIGRPASVADMQALTPSAAGAFYRAWYWQTIAGDALPKGVDLMVFDNGVLSGEVTSAKQLQAILGVQVDGQIGPLSLAAVKRISSSQLIGNLASAQERRYRSLGGFAEFGNGWLSRLGRRSLAAMAMLTPT